MSIEDPVTGGIELSFGSGEPTLARIRRLAERCAAADGFLQEPRDDAALNFDPTIPPWIVARVDGRTAGAIACFSPFGTSLEITAWTDPPRRRAGIFRTLARAAGAVARERNIPALLFVSDGRSEAGAHAAASLGARADFSEHEMTIVLPRSGAPTGFSASSPPFDLAIAADRDLEGMVGASVAIFGDPEDSARVFLKTLLADDSRTMYLLHAHGNVVGMGSLSSGSASEFAGDRPIRRASLNGIGIRPEYRGRGLGRILVGGILGRAEAAGIAELTLEVGSGNAQAIRLYRTMGFAETRRIDYHRLDLVVPPRPGC